MLIAGGGKGVVKNVVEEVVEEVVATPTPEVVEEVVEEVANNSVFLDFIKANWQWGVLIIVLLFIIRLVLKRVRG